MYGNLHITDLLFVVAIGIAQTRGGWILGGPKFEATAVQSVSVGAQLHLTLHPHLNQQAFTLLHLEKQIPGQFGPG